MFYELTANVINSIINHKSLTYQKARTDLLGLWWYVSVGFDQRQQIIILRSWPVACVAHAEVLHYPGACFEIVSYANVLRASSRLPSPRTSFVGDECMTSQKKCLRGTLVFPASRKRLVLKRIMSQSLLIGEMPYITYTGMCRPTGSWFWSSWFRTGYPFQRRFLERGIIFNKTGNK